MLRRFLLLLLLTGCLPAFALAQTEIQLGQEKMLVHTGAEIVVKTVGAPTQGTIIPSSPAPPPDAAQQGLPPAPPVAAQAVISVQAVPAAQAAQPAASVPPPPAADAALPPEPMPFYNMVVLQGLNKVTGKTSRLEGPVGTVLRFGSLEIIARRCWKASPEEQPENAALLEIRELEAGEEPQRVFLGWMFSSSPGLSGLEHPVYDINVLSCEMLEDPEKNEAAGKPAASEAKKPSKSPKKKKKK